MRLYDQNQYWLEGEYRIFWDLGKHYSKKLEPIYIESSEFCELLSKVDDSELWDDSQLETIKVRKYTPEIHQQWIAYKSKSLHFKK